MEVLMRAISAFTSATLLENLRAPYTFSVERHFVEKIRPHTWMRSSSRVVGMKTSPGAATIWREFKPQGRSRGQINKTRRVSTTHCGELSAWIWRPVIYLQQIITKFRVKLIKHQLDAVATGYCDTPGASLVVRIIAGVLGTRKAPSETPIFGQRTSCKKFHLPWNYLHWIYMWQSAFRPSYTVQICTWSQMEMMFDCRMFARCEYLVAYSPDSPPMGERIIAIKSIWLVLTWNCTEIHCCEGSLKSSSRIAMIWAEIEPKRWPCWNYFTRGRQVASEGHQQGT